eukprot:3735005-Prorocentrum_lima.AAC.1
MPGRVCTVSFGHMAPRSFHGISARGATGQHACHWTECARACAGSVLWDTRLVAVAAPVVAEAAVLPHPSG